ncbi:MAG: 50S ribosomal protein L30 [Candidatus Aminicenantales bacterium]
MAVKKNPEKGKKITRKTPVKKKPESREKQLKIKLVRSLIGRPKTQREVVKGLGLRKVNSEVIRKDTPEIWGMIRKIPHLVSVEVVDTK